MMKEFKIQLKKMGETIANSMHAATLLRNMPESLRPIAQTIQIITNDPDNIEEILEAHKANLNAIKISSQAAMAFAARSNPIKHPSSNIQTPMNIPKYNQAINTPVKDNTLQPFYHCKNCGRG